MLIIRYQEKVMMVVHNILIFRIPIQTQALITIFVVAVSRYSKSQILLLSLALLLLHYPINTTPLHLFP